MTYQCNLSFHLRVNCILLVVITQLPCILKLHIISNLLTILFIYLCIQL